MMKQLFSLYIFIALGMAMCACSDDLHVEVTNPSEFEEGELVKASLSVSVANHEMSVQDGARAVSPEELVSSPEENWIHNLWIFQFDTNGNKLKSPKYMIIEKQEQLRDLEVELSPNASSTIYVITNTHDETWGTNIATLEALQDETIPSPGIQYPKVKETDKELSLPMGGSLFDVTVTENSSIKVTVMRMYAKLKIKVKYGEAVSDMTTQSIGIRNLPEYCQVIPTIKDAETGAIDYPADIAWSMEGINTAGDEQDRCYTAYVPENKQGRVEIPDGFTRDKCATGNTLALDITARTADGSDCVYTVYPGSEEDNMPADKADFNIVRNHVYLVTVTIKNIPERIPSANCFVVAPGQQLSFWPYVRDEVGGGYNINTYLDPTNDNLKIERVEIIWQTKGAIGDNSDPENQLVWMTGSGIDTKIHVKAKEEGNALIAAYNNDGIILWSWHIWITNYAPDNVGNQIDYTTYFWDNTQIYTNRRARGTPIMMMNLGALSSTYEEHIPSGTKTKAFGMLYQWGRKDPFPPLRKGFTKIGATMEYTIENTEPLFDNANNPSIEMTTFEDGKKLFSSIPGARRNTIAVNENEASPDTEPILYAIQHPTKFMCGTKTIVEADDLGKYNPDEGSAIFGQSRKQQNNIRQSDNYAFEGQWGAISDDYGLWGAYALDTGTKPDGTPIKSLTLPMDGKNVTIHDSYGPKSIFDPCPRGWMVPPGELWLGFTSTGVNPKNESEINWKYPLPGDDIPYNDWEEWDDENRFDVEGPGLHMFVQTWRDGPTLYFPTQGTRSPDGYGYRVGACGNYSNTTAEKNGRVNILHLHGRVDENFWTAFMLFEVNNYNYYVKSTAGPIRCVRERQY